MTAAPLPLAVVGAGRVARAVHLPLLRLMPDILRLVAIVETDPDRAAAASEQNPGVEVTGDLDTAVRSGARAILCTTPWPTHAQIVQAALADGFPVLCEKPVSLDPDEIADLIRAERARDGLVSVGYMKRHDPAVIQFIEAVSSALPRLRQLTVAVCDPNAPHQLAHLMASPLTPTPDTRNAADLAIRRILGDASPGQRYAYTHGFGGSLIHHVNLVHAILAGSPAPCLAGSLRYASIWAGGDAVASGWWPSPGTGVQMSYLHVPRHRDYHERVEAVFDDFRLAIQLPSPYLLDRAATITGQAADGGRTRWTPPPGHNGFTCQLRAWAASISAGGPALPGLSEASADLAVVREATDLAVIPAGSTDHPAQPTRGAHSVP